MHLFFIYAIILILIKEIYYFMFRENNNFIEMIHKRKGINPEEARALLATVDEAFNKVEEEKKKEKEALRAREDLGDIWEDVYNNWLESHVDLLKAYADTGLAFEKDLEGEEDEALPNIDPRINAYNIWLKTALPE